MSYLITDLSQLTPRHLTEILRKNGALERGDVTRITYTLHPRTTDVNVDGYILAHLSITYSSTPAEELTEFFNYRTIGGYEMPDNTAIFCIFPIPIRRRELQRQNPQRGGKRPRYGGTTWSGCVKNTLVKHVKHGLTRISGFSKQGISLYSLEGNAFAKMRRHKIVRC